MKKANQRTVALKNAEPLNQLDRNHTCQKEADLILFVKEIPKKSKPRARRKPPGSLSK